MTANGEDYRALNRASWDDRAAAHAASDDYSVDRFRVDPTFLSHVVQFDLPRLGDLSGLDGLHLQCHIGTDTLSLARLGARMTGLDFSGESLSQARELAAETGAKVEFVQSDVYEAVPALGAGRFDFVFTGVGALCWLPDVRRWAAIVAELLRPGGRLFMREGHPVLWALDDARPDGSLVLEYPYFEREEPLVWHDDDTYVQTDATFTHNTVHNWNHGLGEVVTALLDQGLVLTQLVEHDSVPWEPFPGKMERLEGDERRMADRPWRAPLTYTLQARKPE
ncbi:class I SAM-dependent methyltransferase [Cryptosporangium phraense]|uniref:Class I SAM-dependent methyltransferase n=1 Tax=Cryptosporangium phraense TaxID=2593070 RepID=A0A545AGW7_9ACTN|nr:class I SAM-dependent methyltransferase [Cryptosporangium phraense]TQS40561.1 class I SAM-dependent methyltransferase [Cryptosporangium phraense]